MNMKKTVAGLAAGVVAISAMAATVSAKNSVTYTEDQKAQNKIFDFTSTPYNVTWTGTASASYKYTTTTTTGSSTIDFGGLTFTNANAARYTIKYAAPTAGVNKISVTEAASVITVKPGAAVTASATDTILLGVTANNISIRNTTDNAVYVEIVPAVTGTPASAVKVSDTSIRVYLASDTVVTDIDADINTALTAAGITGITAAEVGTNATAVSAVTVLAAKGTAEKAADNTVTSADIALLPVGVSVSGTYVAATAPADATLFEKGFNNGNTAVTGLPMADTTPTEMRIKFFKPTTDTSNVKSTDVVEVDSARLKVTGYVKSTVANVQDTLVTKEYSLLYDKDAKNWKLTQVTGATVTSDGKIDLTYFSGGILGYDLSYTIIDKSKAKETDAKKLAEDKMHRALATISFDTVTPNAAFVALKNSFDVDAGKGATTIDTGKGKVDGSGTKHGFTITGFHSKEKDGKISVVKEDSLYILNKINNNVSANANAWNAGGYDSAKYDKEIYTGAYFKEDAAEGKAGEKFVTDDVSYVKDMNLQNILPYIQTMIGDAKGATLTFGLYEGSTSDGGKKADAIDLDSVAKLGSTGTADDLAIALNYSSARTFTKGSQKANGKIEFKWDDLKQGLASGTIYEMALRVGSGKTFVIDTLTIDVPAKSLSDLAAGESVADSASSIAAPVTEATTAATTAAAANPTTGNAPIALAVIPVAIIAAAVIAKKRG